MPSCKDCKFAYRKGHWCEKYRKNTMPYHLACIDGFQPNADAIARSEMKFPLIVDFKVNSMYVMARGIEKLIYDIDQYMKKYRNSFSDEKAKRFARIESYISKLKGEFDELEKDYERNLSPSDYDLMNRDANELVRLVLLFGDKCSRDQENNDNIFRHLRSMKGEGVLKEEDLARFYKK